MLLLLSKKKQMIVFKFRLLTNLCYTHIKLIQEGFNSRKNTIFKSSCLRQLNFAFFPHNFSFSVSPICCFCLKAYSNTHGPLSISWFRFFFNFLCKMCVLALLPTFLISQSECEQKLREKKMDRVIVVIVIVLNFKFGI